MIKWLILIVAAFVLYKLFMGDRGRKKEQEVETKKRMAATGEMVKDPVCGTYVPADANIRARDGNKVYAFCSYECRDAFVKRLEAVRTQSVEQAEEKEKAETGRS
uniref:TRASH domain-containing protein n=1 Tax=Desulfovibrio sp. U5L TaxID=596152 RepID=I2Q120_9BACT